MFFERRTGSWNVLFCLVFSRWRTSWARTRTRREWRATTSFTSRTSPKVATSTRRSSRSARATPSSESTSSSRCNAPARSFVRSPSPHASHHHRSLNTLKSAHTASRREMLPRMRTTSDVTSFLFVARVRHLFYEHYTTKHIALGGFLTFLLPSMRLVVVFC